MRTSIVIVAALAIMLMGLVGSAIILLDDERLKSQVIAHAESNSGRKVEILGSLRVQLFPRLQLNAETVVFRDPDQPDAPAFFAAERMELSVRLLPLIRGRVVPEEIRLAGARLSLQADDAGVNGLEAPVVNGAGESDAARLSSVPIIVDDLMIEVRDATDRVRQTFELEQVQLSGFALNRPVAFRFSGNFGEPPLFDQLEVTGRMVSSSDGRIRLDPMHLAGSLEQGRYIVDVAGALGLHPGDEPQVALDGARLKVNEHEFDLDLTWRGHERPYLSATLATELLDIGVLAALEQLAMFPHDPDRAAVLAAAAAVDFDLQLDLGRVARRGLVLGDVSAQVSARDGDLRLAELHSTVPGGLLLAEATLDLLATEPRWTALAELELVQAGLLFESLGREDELTGVGRMSLALSSRSQAAGSAALSWQGQAELKLWEGHWSLLAYAKAAADVEPADWAFDWLESNLVFSPGRIEWQSLRAGSDAWVANGELDVSLPGDALNGFLEFRDAQGRLQLMELAGSLREPELLAPPLPIAGSQ